ncbi:MAG TPA: TadE/TadG family type IV pilus assembly protein [Chloroflexota bacterium]|nr:TadE/TadG family type IV pilus assembly protein [Chloroflexota bacterium]
MRTFTESSPQGVQRSTGQAIIEFALIAPIMLIMLLGMIDLGRAFVYGVTAQEGARQAARLAAVANYDSTIDDSAVLGRLIAASDPALNGCASVTTAQTCGGGAWTLSTSVTNGGSTYNTIANARAANALAGATVTLTASGSVALFPGFQAGAMGMSLPQISVQGQAVMVVL